MVYDFNEDICRYNTACSKWDNVLTRCGRADVLPMWTADTDFTCPLPIIDAVKKRAEHPIYGYPYTIPEFYDTTVAWIGRRHGWQIQRDWVVFTTGVVPVFQNSIQAFTQEGDEVIVQPPVYHSFRHAIEENGRVCSNNRLIYRDGQYSMDFEDLEQRAASPKAKMMIMCSPHNPVGRVWTAEELSRVEEICLRHDVILVIDEIHSDLVFKGKHIPLASIDERYLQNTITCYAPSKTFNTAGLRGSGIIVPNPKLRVELEKRFKMNKGIMQNIFAVPAYIAAYTQCDDYLEQLVPYLQGNIDYVRSVLQEKMPRIRLVEPEATFLIWLDCSELGLKGEQIMDFFLNKARIGIVNGMQFGPGGEDFARINIGCPRFRVQQAFEQIAKAYKEAGY